MKSCLGPSPTSVPTDFRPSYIRKGLFPVLFVVFFRRTLTDTSFDKEERFQRNEILRIRFLNRFQAFWNCFLNLI